VLALADERMYQRKRGGRVPATRQSANVLAAVVEEHAPQLAEHMRSVAELAYATAVEVGVVGAELEALRYAAALHDIGKMAIPHEILAKRGPLEPDEWELMRQHTIVGERILASAPALERSARLVRWTHERIDGGGYPDGLRGDQIPLATRIITVTNAFDAMVTERPHAAALSPDDALAELHRCAGTQFDLQVAAAFERALPQTARGPAPAALAEPARR
jgi:two-component system, cell cycle response regulator